MDKHRIAKTISTFTNPPIICIPLFLIICLTLSIKHNQDFWTLEIVSLVFASILPMAIIMIWAKLIGTDNDISNRSDRYIPLIVGIVSYFIGFLISLSMHLDNFLTCLLLCYTVNTGVVLVITTKWKISVHTTGLSGPNAALILLLGPIGALFGILYPLVIWSRVLLKKHTLAQAISGGAQGYFLTVLEMYLFMNILNLPITGMVSLADSILYILAIITTPVILGVLSYTSKSRRLFIILELACLALFMLFTPFNIWWIFIIITLASVLITYYAGDEFIWHDVLS
ncbi:hypothetical protein [uncultured Methanobrevibacter sp.]|uniref:hypothetical protein n=1 Tax=uncultured Methanobrevibacter sp. TaxID=253161 RepID=UPI0025D7F853|nr:hypothetical protein [uncultured Methanobrevibacter sp.]